MAGCKNTLKNLDNKNNSIVHTNSSKPARGRFRGIARRAWNRIGQAVKRPKPSIPSAEELRGYARGTPLARIPPEKIYAVLGEKK
ncbi:hypothetical protein KKE06_05595 [Candidatus Micrarchaeota archaeon]|nr:hypothetical protein [Candidatus Micrarchaeota archaeon]MBU1930601.1 hypothetical protein [Candidatus Micrarchaeota archaeon]